MIGCMEAIRKYNNSDLLQYLQDIENEGNHKHVIPTSTNNIYTHNVSTLMLAIKLTKSQEVIFKLIHMGGKELVLWRHLNNTTALHYACRHKSPSLEVISKLIQVGGRDLVHARDVFALTALHIACENKFMTLDIISKLLEAGGKELVMVNNQYGTALHYACGNAKISPEIVPNLIDVGGKDLVMVHNSSWGTALHRVCWNGSSHLMDHVSKLVEVGGRELLIMKNRFGRTALQHGCLHTKMFQEAKCHDAFEFLFQECILEEIGGEFEIGGLFTSHRINQSTVYHNWAKYLPVLKSIVASLQGQTQPPPILHAAILNQAPLNIIESIIQEFEYSVLKRDSLNRLPIEVAFLEENICHKSLHKVIQATSAAQPYNSIAYIAAHYGLKWKYSNLENYGMNKLACETAKNVTEVLDSHDSLTGLRLFMVAAMGDWNDLGSIYNIMKMSPQIINA